MRTAHLLFALPVFCLLLLTTTGANAVSPEEIALAKESEDRCQETAKDPVSAKLIMNKMADAVALVNKEGKASFPKFKGKDSPFIFSGTYIWIHNLNNGVMLMHPVKPMMVGQKLIGLKDGNGKRFFVEMNQVVRSQGDGWVDYTWPKPGENERSNKVSYVHKAVCDGQEVVLGCGVYDKTRADIMKELEK